MVHLHVQNNKQPYRRNFRRYFLQYKIKIPQNGGFVFFVPLSINENRIRRPILGTFVQDMVHLRMQVRERMLL